MTQTRPGWVEYRGRTLYDTDGSKIGRIVEIYLDDEGGHAEWALVHTGLFGSKQTFVPLRGATGHGDDLKAQVHKERAQNAPSIDPDGHLSEDDEQRLFDHYGIPYTTEGSTTARGGDEGGASTGTEQRGATGRQGTTGDQGTTDSADRRSATGRETEGHDTSGPTTDDAMTRSEEELRVGTETQERSRARLRKYVVTETETHTVPVTREEVRVEREPITDANRGAATDGPAISEEEHEVVLHEERPTVEKEVVPKERVRLGKEVERDQEQVSEQVRKEQVESDDVSGADTTARGR